MNDLPAAPNKPQTEAEKQLAADIAAARENKQEPRMPAEDVPGWIDRLRELNADHERSQKWQTLENMLTKGKINSKNALQYTPAGLKPNPVLNKNDYDRIASQAKAEAAQMRVRELNAERDKYMLGRIVERQQIQINNTPQPRQASRNIGLLRPADAPADPPASPTTGKDSKMSDSPLSTALDLADETSQNAQDINKDLNQQHDKEAEQEELLVAEVAATEEQAPEAEKDSPPEAKGSRSYEEMYPDEDDDLEI